MTPSHRSRRAALWTVLIISLLPFVARAQPNVVIFVADDLGWADVGFHGEEVIETPNLDRLAAEGVQLDRFYTAPICSPTRAALMTGRDPMRLGLAYGVVMPWSNHGVHPDELFMPEAFRRAGYQTAMVGKWHLGHAQETYHPNRRGFDHFYGHLHTGVGFFPPFSVLGGVDFQRNGERIEDEGYETFLLGAEAARWVRARDESKPFFLYVPFIAPHLPLDAPKELLDKYADMADDRPATRTKETDRLRIVSRIMGVGDARQVYAAVVDAMDQAIGTVLAALDDEGIANETIVLFLSDNGGDASSLAGADNAPLRGGKSQTFEGGIRVVAVMRWPAKLPAGSVHTSIVSVMDVFPTLAAAADVPIESPFTLDGSNLLPTLESGQRGVRDDYLFFASEVPIPGQFRFTAFNDEWKLVQEVDQELLSADVTNYLFRIRDDPGEHNNLANAHRDVVERMSEAILDWRRMHPAAGVRHKITPPPGWRAPLDWTDYPRPVESLQSEAAIGMAPEFALPIIDYRHGDAGRVRYNCEPYPFLKGGLCK